MVEHLKKIDLVIPCAGMGTRLGYLTKNITKNMVKINGVSILEHQLNKFYIHKKKINKVHFILGYKASILKSYILKLNLPFKINFHINKNFKKTGCAYSLSFVLKYLRNDALILNSDLILKQEKISNIIKNKKINFVYLRKPKLNKKSRAVKASIDKNKIIKIDILNNNFNFDVVGPFKLNIKSILILKKIYKSINSKEFLRMSCYSFFGKLVNYIDLDYHILKDSDWYEVNTIKEYKNSFKEKIFKFTYNY